MTTPQPFPYGTHLDIRTPVTRTQPRAELEFRLPFAAEIVICDGREIAALMSRNHFKAQPHRPLSRWKTGIATGRTGEDPNLRQAAFCPRGSRIRS
jgi:hypothetical protein